MSGCEAAVRFVRALLPDGTATRTADGLFRVERNGTERLLDAATVERLVTDGVLEGRDRCRPGPNARTWLRKRLSEGEAAPTRQANLAVGPDGAIVNLAESPLARLAQGGQHAFLAPHQVEAGERIRRLVERAGLQPRLTMSYSATHVAGGSATSAADMSDFAADARKKLNLSLASLPRDCAGVVLDVCGFLKGLQQIEQERGWPRRSAKLVLRIGLEQLAGQFGLASGAVGRESGTRNWLADGARPTRFE